MPLQLRRLRHAFALCVVAHPVVAWSPDAWGDDWGPWRSADEDPTSCLHYAYKQNGGSMPGEWLFYYRFRNACSSPLKVDYRVVSEKKGGTEYPSTWIPIELGPQEERASGGYWTVGVRILRVEVRTSGGSQSGGGPGTGDSANTYRCSLGVCCVPGAEVALTSCQCPSNTMPRSAGTYSKVCECGKGTSWDEERKECVGHAVVVPPRASSQTEEPEPEPGISPDDSGNQGGTGERPDGMVSDSGAPAGIRLSEDLERKKKDLNEASATMQANAQDAGAAMAAVAGSDFMSNARTKKLSMRMQVQLGLGLMAAPVYSNSKAGTADGVSKESTSDSGAVAGLGAFIGVGFSPVYGTWGSLRLAVDAAGGGAPMMGGSSAFTQVDAMGRGAIGPEHVIQLEIDGGIGYRTLVSKQNPAGISDDIASARYRYYRFGAGPRICLSKAHEPAEGYCDGSLEFKLLLDLPDYLALNEPMPKVLRASFIGRGYGNIALEAGLSYPVAGAPLYSSPESKAKYWFLTFGLDFDHAL